MNAASEFDLGPLTWVKSEIDLALERATEALALYAGSNDATHLKFARTHIHQANGALAIVGLDGVTQVAESLEALLVLLEEGQSTAAGDVFDAFEESLSAIRQYLDDLLAGAPNQPLRLLPAYEALAKARGLSNTHAADLFYPDLNARPEKRAGDTETPDAEAQKTLIKSERARYQKALLTFLKKPEETGQAIASLRQAIAAIEALQDSPANRVFWWVSLGFIDSLTQAEIAADPRARQLCSHIDGQIRRLLEGTRTVAERLLRDALYFIAQTPAGLLPLVDQISNTFRLHALIPGATPAPAPLPHESALRRLREALTAGEESWNKFCAGNGGSLSSFAENAQQTSLLCNEIGQTDLKRLGQAFAAVANWLTDNPGKPSDSVAMEVATAILLLQSAIDNFRQLGTDFAQQVDLMVARLYGCITGNSPEDHALPALDDMTRRAQEKLLIGQVAREIQNNLAQVEQTLDGFFRDPAKTAELAAVDGPLKQIGGALAMLGHFGAVHQLKECSAEVQRFAQADYVADNADFETLARQLSLLGFFVDALQHGESSYEAFVARLEGKPPVSTTPEASTPAAQDTPAAVPLEPVSSAALDAEISGEPLKQTETPAPSAATLELADAGHEAIDAELLAIFLEEARDVLATMATQRARLQEAPQDTEALTVIRRGTHTLKGSGRMVGLTELGETAWELEQTLNLWLRQEQAVTAELLDLLQQEQQLFSTWVAALEGSGKAPDPQSLIALARALRGTETLPATAAPAAPAVPVTSAVPELPPAEEIAEEEKLSNAAEALADLLAPEDVADAPAPIAAETDEALTDLLRSTPENEQIPPPGVSASPTLYDIFREEAKGHLHTLLHGMAELENTPALPTAFALTRAAHTLGGTAATVGLMPLNQLAIALEHALLRRDGAMAPDSPESLSTLRLVIDTLQAQFDALAEQQPPSEQPELIAALSALYPPAPVSEDSGPDDAASADMESPPPATPELPQLTDEIDEQLLPLFLAEAEEQLPALSNQLARWRDNPDQDIAPHGIARLLHTFKGNARMAGAMNLGEFTHLLETRVEEAARGKNVSVALLDEIQNGFDALAVATEQLRSGRSPAPAGNAPEVAAEVPDTAETGSEEAAPETSDANAQNASLRVPAKLIDQLVNEAGELSIARARIEGEMRSLKGSLLDLTENVIRLRRQLREIEIQAEGQIQASIAQTSEGDSHFDPLELDRFTRFQELTRFMAESVNDVATVQQNLLKNVDDANAAILAQSRLNRNLQQELMGMRMLPFASQSERLYRIVRQTAKEVGKRANLDIVGGQVDIDRSVLDKMQGPLEHMLRNAVTHGIESRVQRGAAGKPETGEITLSVSQEGNEIILAMVDDGKGLDSAAIRARAESLGLIDSDQEIDDKALFAFIFQPGFSTAGEVTQISGRGVGMDVVKTEVSRLGGRIEIASEEGKGTTFRLYLPLTLAVTQTLLLRTGPHLYAIPSTMIEQVLELKEKPLADMRAKGEAAWLGNRYPFHFLPHLLGEREAHPEAQRQYWVLLLRSGSQRVAIQVDELRGNQEVVVKNIGAQLARVVGIDGATVLGDGKVVLILNPVALAGQSVERSANATPVAVEPPAAARLPTIMVVDDSLTVRKITSRLLAREGYQVILAKDGVDALEQLLEVQPEVILSDVEMPRMDGFDLIRNLRADARTARTPIIMITSRTADKHRQHAMELGANHYLGKPYDEDELLRLVAGYTGHGA